VKEILSRLCRIPGVEGVLMVSSDGLLIAAQTGLGGKAADETASAMVGNLCRSVSVALQKLGRGELKNVCVSGAGGRIAVARAGTAYLAAILDGEINLGLLQLEVGAAANEAARNISL
jgi:predicted regulator of Ras-like GTPase activity (Roadblock/LC7/MglB family)